jgi:hypothetical protein
MSRSALLVAIAAGPLVAHSVATAMDAYAEASGVPGGAAALTQALSPLDGFVAPMFGAYAVLATLLLPFVAIRAVSAEQESGAHTLMLQGPFRVPALVMVKFAALMIVWLALWIPGAVGLAFWTAAGGHLGVAETVGVLAGHALRGAFVIALGIAAAAVSESGASAAVVALGVTLGGWALDFAATVHGGWVAALAQFTPDAALRTFEHGDVQLRVVAVTVVVVGALLVLAMLWLDPARSRGARWALAAAAMAGAVALGTPAAMLRATWDVSEDRRNSFSLADTRALATITAPVHVLVYLGPEDPRRTDLDRHVLRKLARVLPHFDVEYAAQTRTGLFEGAGSHYGEVWYQVGAARELNRSSAEPIVLETVYRLAGVAQPTAEPNDYPGYPLRVRAGWWQLAMLGGLWPLLVLAAWLALRRSGVHDNSSIS